MHARREEGVHAREARALKNLLQMFLESISFLPDIFMLFHFPLFPALLLGYRSPCLPAGGRSQCFSRQGLCLCRPTITFPAEMAKFFFSSPLRVAQISIPTLYSLYEEKKSSILSRRDCVPLQMVHILLPLKAHCF